MEVDLHGRSRWTQRGGAASQLAPDEATALRQQAFQQGMEYAARQISQTQVAREATRQQDDLAALEASNEEKDVRSRTASLGRRRPPLGELSRQPGWTGAANIRQTCVSG